MDLFQVLQGIYFFLPGYFANMAPIIAKHWTPWMAKPVDFGLHWRGKPLLGAHKTYRGYFYGVLFGLAAAYLQHLLVDIPFFQRLSITDYSNWFVLGFLMGFGALFGDSIKSFIKRQVGIASGRPFIPFDQSDFVIGGLLFAALVVDFGLTFGIIIVGASILLHIAVNHLAYALHIRNERW